MNQIAVALNQHKVLPSTFTVAGGHAPTSRSVLILSEHAQNTLPLNLLFMGTQRCVVPPVLNGLQGIMAALMSWEDKEIAAHRPADMEWEVFIKALLPVTVVSLEQFVFVDPSFENEGPDQSPTESVQTSTSQIYKSDDYLRNTSCERYNNSLIDAILDTGCADCDTGLVVADDNFHGM